MKLLLGLSLYPVHHV